MSNDFWDLYKRPEWQRRRLEIMQKADFTCEDCRSSDKTLNVHHGYYERDRKPWEYPDEALHCLCEDCHEQRHGIGLMLKKAIAKLGRSSQELILGYAIRRAYWNEDNFEFDMTEPVACGFSSDDTVSPISFMRLGSRVTMAQAKSVCFDHWEASSRFEKGRAVDEYRQFTWVA